MFHLNSKVDSYTIKVTDKINFQTIQAAIKALSETKFY